MPAGTAHNSLRSISGTSGLVLVAGQSMALDGWTMSIRVALRDGTHYLSPISGNGVIFEQFDFGIGSADITLRGKYDPNRTLFALLGLVGQGTVRLGFTALKYIEMPFICPGWDASSELAGDNQVSWKIKPNGAILLVL